MFLMWECFQWFSIEPFEIIAAIIVDCATVVLGLTKPSVVPVIFNQSDCTWMYIDILLFVQSTLPQGTKNMNKTMMRQK